MATEAESKDITLRQCWKVHLGPPSAFQPFVGQSLIINTSLHYYGLSGKQTERKWYFWSLIAATAIP